MDVVWVRTRPFSAFAKGRRDANLDETNCDRAAHRTGHDRLPKQRRQQVVAVWPQGLSQHEQPRFSSAELGPHRRSGAPVSQPDTERAIEHANCWYIGWRGILALFYKEQLGRKLQRHSFHRYCTSQPHRYATAVQQFQLHTECPGRDRYREHKLDQSVSERNEHHC